MKSVLVLGGSGFLGQSFRELAPLYGYDKVVSVDIADGCDALGWMRHHDEQYDLVVHAAAAQPFRAGIDFCHECAVYNTQLDSSVLHWAVQSNQKHVLYISSCAVYPHLLTSPAALHRFEIGDTLRLHEDLWSLGSEYDVYGLTKSMGERMAGQVCKAGTPVTIIRPFSGYGWRQTTNFPFGAFVHKAMKREMPLKIQANVVRDFVHVDDIVGAGLTLVAKDVVGTPVNVCTGVPMYMSTVAQMIAEAQGYRPKIEVDNEANGAAYRVGDPGRLNLWYMPKVTIEAGVERVVKEVSTYA